MPFKSNLLQRQVPTWESNLGLYLRPISLQLEVGPEPHSKDVNGSVTLVEGLWQGIITLPGTDLQTFAFVKIDFGSCYSTRPSSQPLRPGGGIQRR